MKRENRNIKRNTTMTCDTFYFNFKLTLKNKEIIINYS